MIGKTRLFFLAVLCFMVLTGVSCGKSDGQSEDPKAKTDQADKQQKGKTETPLTKIAKDALDEASIDDEFPAGRQAVVAAGYVVKAYRSFPSQEITKRGRVLVYTDTKGKDSGGVVYLKKTGFQVAPVWHWYFKDMVPDSVVNVEINRDGLWDIRFVSTKGKTERFVQEESFSLFAKERTDWIAMNGIVVGAPHARRGDVEVLRRRHDDGLEILARRPRLHRVRRAVRGCRGNPHDLHDGVGTAPRLRGVRRRQARGGDRAETGGGPPGRRPGSGREGG